MNAMVKFPKLALYAVPSSVPANCRNITPGKHYRVLYDYGPGFAFEDDGGQKIQSLWEDSYQLRGGNWHRTHNPLPPETEPDAEVLAWLYTRTTDDGLRETRADHVRWTSWLAEGWVETPLIAKPRSAASEQAQAA